MTSPDAPTASPARAWLLLVAGDRRQHAGNDGYLDAPSSSYSWDSTVPNHDRVSVGDLVALWDKRVLLGASVVEEITVGADQKLLRRCPGCGHASIKARTTMTPRYLCFDCHTAFDDPLVGTRGVTTYRSRHDAGWTDLAGLLDAAELRRLCVSPASQLSMRPLDWPAFHRTLQSVGGDAVLSPVEGRVSGGHRISTVRVRLGQAAFRTALLAEFGSVCALTGPTPIDALEAAHLYSYAALGTHHRHGGLLLRRDVHRLFDLGRIAVRPGALTIDVEDTLREYSLYSALHGAPVMAGLSPAHLSWLAAHWAQHRARVE